MKKKNLKEILKKHCLWLGGQDGGERADLRNVNLQNVHLRHANLRRANLQGANLRDANLRHASLWDAKLMDANLKGADLRDANFRAADLQGANLEDAILIDAILTDANLRRANLRGADLRGASLWDAKLMDANLQDVNLRSADLRDADLTGCRLARAQYYFPQCPTEGAFIGWKQCRNGVIVKLLIPESAKRSSATSRICRASKAKVLEIYGDAPAVSLNDRTFLYEKGQTYAVDGFCEDRWAYSAAGIHFFITREEAENYEHNCEHISGF